jgi:hypothetical protein
MSTSTVQQSFEGYEKKARVPADQARRARSVQQQVRADFKTDLGSLLRRSFLSGSYARMVQTAPKLKDVDIVFVLNDPTGEFEASAKTALDRLAAASAGSVVISHVEKLCCRAVKLVVVGEEFTVDAVAALEDEHGNIRLARHDPAAGTDDWSDENPRGQIDAHWEKNAQTDGVFIPAVRIIKMWNQRHRWDDGNLLSSYLVEAMLFHAMTEKVDYANAMYAFFRHAVAHLSTPAPSVPCPGNLTKFVDEKLADDRRENALAFARQALGHAEAAMRETNAGRAMDEWAAVFGPMFPAPRADASTLAAALRSGNVRPSGAGIAVGAAGAPAIVPARSWRSQ